MGDLSLEDQGKARWDAYRAAYPDMSYAEVAAAHQWVWDNYPDQSHHSVPQLDAFFASRHTRTVVLEVGGWRGEAAERQLTKYPDIKTWHNFEICEGAVLNPVTKDSRYKPVWPNEWVWDTKPPRANVAVLSHVIEHVSDKQLPKLLSWIRSSGADSIYIEAPMLDGGQSWWGGNTAHVLTMGWDHIVDVLASLGYVVKDKMHAKLDHYVLFVEKG